MSRAGRLELHRVSKTYTVNNRELRVLDQVDLSVEPGGFVGIVGPSGCGKSTLLRLVVGLDDAYEGEIVLDGEHVAGTSLSRGIVFQDHRLLPWLTLRDNIGLGLQNSALSEPARRERIAELLELVGLTGFELVYPHQLSGGMAQRAAIARGLVTEPEILLLDEPLGALDALTRVRLQDELLRIWQRERISMILVTHDVEEAIVLAERIVVMQSNPGRIADVIDLDLPYPRDRASHELADVRRRVLTSMGALAGTPCRSAA